MDSLNQNTKMKSAQKCYCNSDKLFEECCEIYLNNIQKAPTAEALMRSRFTAYCVQAVDYLIQTTHSSTRKFHNKKDIQEWSSMNQWVKLEIINASETVVEFKAYYLNENLKATIHHEHSRFKNENETWFYVDGDFF